jgi:hypothetical protein
MDNPDHCVKRSLNTQRSWERKATGVRQLEYARKRNERRKDRPDSCGSDQKRQFNRASSFTFGQAQHASMMLRTAEATGAAAAANGAAARLDFFDAIGNSNPGSSSGFCEYAEEDTGRRERT